MHGSVLISTCIRIVALRIRCAQALATKLPRRLYKYALSATILPLTRMSPFVGATDASEQRLIGGTSTTVVIIMDLYNYLCAPVDSTRASSTYLIGGTLLVTATVYLSALGVTTTRPTSMPPCPVSTIKDVAMFRPCLRCHHHEDPRYQLHFADPHTGLRSHDDRTSYALTTCQCRCYLAIAAIRQPFALSLGSTMHFYSTAIKDYRD